jgi:aminoglycoside phosphotransferase (APT) family kinase protein
LHTFPLPADCPFVPADAIVTQRASSARHLRQLEDAGVIPTAEASSLRGLLEAQAPAACYVGFIHGDLCAENAILDRLGQVRIVDNEGLSIGPCDGDLARTLYRWPMTTAEMRAYLEVYAEKRGLENFTAGYPFWAIAARLGSAAHRIGAPRRVAEAPLQSLRSLVRAIEIETSPMQRILDSSLGDHHGS